MREVTEREFTRYKWRMLLATMFCYLFFYTGRQTFGFAIPGIQEELGLSKSTLGAISGAMLWCYAVGQIVNGNLADKFGGRRVMALGALLSTALNWFTSFSVGPKSLGALWGANGFVQAMGFPSGGKVISGWWSTHERGKSFGFYNFAAGLASVLAFVTSTLVVEVFDLDWRWIFRVPVLLMLVGGSVFFIVARDDPRQAKITPPRSWQADREHPDQVAGTTNGKSLGRYRLMLRNPKVWLTGSAVGFNNAARYGLLIWVPVYLLGSDWKSDGSGISPIWVSVALPVGMALGALVNGQMSDRLFRSRRDYPIALFMALAAVTALAMYALALPLIPEMCLMFLLGFFVYGPHSTFWALSTDIAGKTMAGTAIGVVNFFGYIFSGVAEPLIGHMMDRTGNTALIFPVVTGCCLCSCLFALTVRR
ncbi:major facilitator transporter [Mycolicibacterium goodii]|uniref:Major facilitator transporter n=2 Tax=Mycolicibacterium goodii TaxID=134601 RepID=A0A0K0XH43_MYCGD|nr:major facilitator transporter [Mycolicibacterium goodii]